VAAAPAREHQRLLGRLHVLLHEAVEEPGLGEVSMAPVDVRFSERDQVQPDLLVLLNDNLGRYRGNTVFGPPDLVVKIASPSTRRYDDVEKAHLFAANGVPESWQPVPPTPEHPTGGSFRIQILRSGLYVPVAPDDDGRLHSTVVPGLTVAPSALLAGLF
jgi:Uma2 family endonuclease